MLDTALIVLIIIVILGLAFDFINGFHDTANAIATSVATRVLSPGKAVLMVSSYLPELLGTCDRIAVMCRGVLGPARPVGEVDEHQIMQEATGTTVAAAAAPAGETA